MSGVYVCELKLRYLSSAYVLLLTDWIKNSHEN